MGNCLDKFRRGNGDNDKTTRISSDHDITSAGKSCDPESVVIIEDAETLPSPDGEAVGETSFSRKSSKRWSKKQKRERILLPEGQKEKIGMVKLPGKISKSSIAYKVVVAIDFGTTFTGFAYSYYDDKQSVTMNKNWANVEGGGTFKAPTCALYDSEEKFVAFGYEAQKRYDEEPEEESEEEKMYLYEKFKMELDRTGKGKLTKSTKIESECGHEMTAMTVFADVLKYLKHKFLNDAKHNEHQIEAKDILWVLTVPAIWNDSQKFFMRQAVLQAGLIDNISSKRLIIALEPEVASYYCRSLKIKGKQLDVGDRYIILDAGGGTVDVTVHDIQKDGSCKEVCAPTGGPFGGNNINRAWEQYMGKVLGGSSTINELKKTPSCFYQLKCYFETQKVSWKPGNKISLTQPYGLDQNFKKVTKQDLSIFLQDKETMGIELKGGKLKIKSDVVEEFFKKWIDFIVDLLDKLIADHKLSKVPILLVGGFSESKCLKDAIFGEYGKRYDIIIPENPSLAVLKGAAMFGHRDDFIRSRKSPCTYYILGVREMTSKDRNINPRRSKEHMLEYLSPVIHKNEDVEFNTEKTRYAEPAVSSMTSVYVTLYSSPEEQVIDNPYDPRVTKITTVEIQVPAQLTDKTIAVTFLFGGTDIKVTARNSAGEEVDTELAFNQTMEMEKGRPK